MHIQGVFSPNTAFFYELAQLAPYELTHVRASPGDYRMRLAGRKRHARFESSEALAELPAVARTAVEVYRTSADLAMSSCELECTASVHRFNWRRIIVPKGLGS